MCVFSFIISTFLQSLLKDPSIHPSIHPFPLLTPNTQNKHNRSSPLAAWARCASKAPASPPVMWATTRRTARVFWGAGSTRGIRACECFGLFGGHYLLPSVCVCVCVCVCVFLFFGGSVWLCVSVSDWIASATTSSNQSIICTLQAGRGGLLDADGAHQGAHQPRGRKDFAARGT